MEKHKMVKEPQPIRRHTVEQYLAEGGKRWWEGDDPKELLVYSTADLDAYWAALDKQPGA